MSRIAILTSTACLVAGTVIGASVAYASQFHMMNALELLRSARAQLELASPHRGGHRERALEAVDRALYETREGMAFAGSW
jgi:hypothetical protein